ncbi:serine/threonine-protein kinase [Amycolatopsis sp. 195334CR]|uniref:serine/threonine-protein kinase n=1 Tax=Amycolatopsis sp. 195334CR TaxID=2814588 RepID=UPI001A8E5BFF|nr:serine/threonine-protein kinase [Amycolatopsis sp. 195334CR]MBN6041200.1 serine/threonine protein kinase [Amycolatopsis sp. 195334CR]
MKPLDPAEPRTAGRYRLLASLGEGAMGRVLLALSPDGRLAALKQIHPEFAHDNGFRDRFRHEVEASRKVSGAYTAAVLDADADAEVPWLASVHVPGPNLREAVDAAGPLPPEAVRYLAAGLATALADIHRAGLVHRDLKPGNVLLAADGPRVIDFGIARAVEGSDLTSTGAIIGSPAFMSPEQATSGVLTPASDVFSLGALLVMAATGRAPFTGNTAAQTLYNIVHTRPDLSGLPPGIAELAEPCLAKEPALRPTPRQLLGLLGPVPPGAGWPDCVRDLIAAQDARIREVLSWPVPEPLKRSRGKVTAVLAGVLCAAAVAFAATAGFEDVIGGRATALPLPVGDALADARLRQVDPCRVLDGVELDPVGEFTAWRSEEPGECTYETSEADLNVWLTIGMDSDAGTESGRDAGVDIDGLPVLLTDVDTGCGALVQTPARPELGIGIQFPTGTADTCAPVTAVLRVVVDRLRTEVFRWEAPPHSAFLADPCSLVDGETARSAVGGATKATPYLLRGCRWEGPFGTMSLGVTQGEPGKPPRDAGDPTKVDGTDAYLSQVNTGHCVLTWTQRQIDDQRTEVLEVTSNRTGDPCGTATAYARAIMAKLSG